jgi:predicted methyltransferase
MYKRRTIFSLSLVLAAACGSSTQPPPTTTATPTAQSAQPQVEKANVTVPPETKAIIDAPDRDAEDKKLDAGRKPGETLAFYNIKPGMKVAELGSGSGYTTEILARAVGPTGVVYAHNNQWIVEKFADKAWRERLAKPENKNVVKIVRELDDPLPPEAKDLDAVFIVLLYHDVYWMGADRTKMNASVFRALKPGGIYAVIDHSGRAGTGSTEVKTVHRIEESTVRQDVAKAGFRLVAEADFMRNKDDTRDWNPAPFAAGEKRGTSDRFVLKFVKPGP